MANPAKTCILFTIIFAFVRLSAAEMQEPVSGHWIGMTDYFRYPMLIELDFPNSRNEHAPSLEVFAEASMGFDSRILKIPLEVHSNSEGALQFVLSVRGKDVRFDGRVLGNVLSGNLTDGDKTYQLRAFHGIAPDPDALSPYLGVYTGDESRYAITWREYGGLRLVNLETGWGETLLPVDEGKFFTKTALRKNAFPGFTVKFPKDRRKKIMGLVLVDEKKDASTFYRKITTFEQMRVPFRNGTQTLAGTLILNKSNKPLPLVVMVHGSGPIYRTALFERAVMVADLGCAVYIYDKRRTGESEGRWEKDDLSELASDARAAVNALRNHPYIDPTRIGLMGHSQAGYVIPVATRDNDAVAFAVIVNGGGINPAEQSLYDKKNDLEREGFSVEDQASALTLMKRVHAYVLHKEGNHSELSKDYLAAQRQPWFDMTDLPRLEAVPSWEENPEVLEAFRKELGFDVLGYQRQMKLPTLVLLGEKDETVPPAIAEQNWRETMATAGNKESRVVVIPGADHGLRIPVENGHSILAPEYRKILQKWFQEIGVTSS